MICGDIAGAIYVYEKEKFEALCLQELGDLIRVVGVNISTGKVRFTPIGDCVFDVTKPVIETKDAET